MAHLSYALGDGQQQQQQHYSANSSPMLSGLAPSYSSEPHSASTQQQQQQQSNRAKPRERQSSLDYSSQGPPLLGVGASSAAAPQSATPLLSTLPAVKKAPRSSIISGGASTGAVLAPIQTQSSGRSHSISIQAGGGGSDMSNRVDNYAADRSPLSASSLTGGGRDDSGSASSRAMAHNHQRGPSVSQQRTLSPIRTDGRGGGGGGSSSRPAVPQSVSGPQSSSASSSSSSTLQPGGAAGGAGSLSSTPRHVANGGGGGGGGSFAAASGGLTPSFAPASVVLLPHAVPAAQSSGALVALHVSDAVFLTTPETLARVAQWEAQAAGGSSHGGGRALSSIADSEPSLLQWIAEDALNKHREAESFTLSSHTSASSSATLRANPFSQGALLGSPPGAVVNKQQRSPSTGPEASPRLAGSGAGGGTGMLSQVHQSGCGVFGGGQSSVSASALAFHAPSYSYFLDRNPAAYPLLLLYCRDGGAALQRALVASAPWPGPGVSSDASLLAALKQEAEWFGLSGLAALIELVQTGREVDRLLDTDDRFWADVVHTIDAMFPLDSSNGGQATPRRDREARDDDQSVTRPPGTISPSAGPRASPHGGRPISPISRLAPGQAIPSPATALTQRASAASGSLQRNSNLQRNIGAMLRRLAFERDPLLRVCHASYRDAPEYEERLLEILHTTCTLCKRTIFYRPIGLREGRDTGCPVHPSSGVWDRKQRMWTCCGSPDFKDSGCQNSGIHYTVWTFWNSDS